MTTQPTPANTSHIDGNQNPSIIGVAGTLGTADVAGTSPTVPIGVNPITGAVYVEPTVFAGGTTNIQGSVQVTGGTLGALTNGSINILSGTLLNTGTNVNVVTGTLQNSGSSTGVGVVSALTNGSVNILTGTIQSSGTSTGVGVVSALTNGSVNILTGTLQSAGTVTGVGVVTGLTNGSVNVLTGTVTLVSTVTTVSNLTNGSVNLLTGTVTSVTNLAGGTVQLNRIPTQTQSTFGTVGTTGVTIFGTLAGGTSSGAGTEIFVTGVSIVIPATAGSQDVSVGFGTNAGTFHSGTAVLVRGFFIAGGGISRQFDPPVNSGTNAQVAYFQAGAGTASIDITFFTAASTL